jgi:hypothetical protein
LQTLRAVTGWSEASAETRLTAVKGSMGCQSGQRAAARAAGSHRRQSHRRWPFAIAYGRGALTYSNFIDDAWGL